MLDSSWLRVKRAETGGGSGYHAPWSTRYISIYSYIRHKYFTYERERERERGRTERVFLSRIDIFVSLDGAVRNKLMVSSSILCSLVHARYRIWCLYFREWRNGSCVHSLPYIVSPSTYFRDRSDRRGRILSVNYIHICNFGYLPIVSSVNNTYIIMIVIKPLYRARPRNS